MWQSSLTEAVIFEALVRALVSKWAVEGVGERKGVEEQKGVQQ